MGWHLLIEEKKKDKGLGYFTEEYLVAVSADPRIAYSIQNKFHDYLKTFPPCDWTFENIDQSLFEIYGYCSSTTQLFLFRPARRKGSGGTSSKRPLLNPHSFHVGLLTSMGQIGWNFDKREKDGDTLTWTFYQ